jgi:hypothetical protein
MTTPTIKKLNLTLITAVAALIASCNSGNQYYAGATIHAGGCDQNNNPYFWAILILI